MIATIPTTINKDNIIGKVVFTLPYVGSFLCMLKTTPGIVSLVLFIITVILILYLWDDYKRQKIKNIKFN